MLTTEQAVEVCEVLDRAAEMCRHVGDVASDEIRDRLDASVGLVMYELAGLRQRIARASRKVNNTPRPVPTKPGPKQAPPPKEAPPPKKGGQT